MDRDECAALVAFVRALPRPVELCRQTRRRRRGSRRAGDLRRDRLRGVPSAKLGDVEGIYSDLLCTTWGPKLVDTGSYGVFVARPAGAGGPNAEGGPRGESAGVMVQEWRTPPLWGLRDSAPYLHDGRAATIGQAIAQHGGQGAAAARGMPTFPPSQGTARRVPPVPLSPPREDEQAELAEARRLR
jgi:hypothetical protein